MRLQFRKTRLIGLCGGAGLSLCLALVGGAPSSAQQTSSAPGAGATAAAKVDPAAVKALTEMSTFLQGLSTFSLASRTSLDIVTYDEQKIQLVGTASYKVRKPDAFVIDVVSSSWNRRYIYAGRQFTVYAPELAYYATVPAPATIQATVVEVGDRFGISLPLDDLSAGPARMGRVRNPSSRDSWSGRRSSMASRPITTPSAKSTSTGRSGLSRVRSRCRARW